MISGGNPASNPPQNKRFLILAALFFLLPVYPFLSMLWYHGYPVFSLEAGMVVAAAATFALTLAWLLRSTSVFVTNLLIGLILLLVFTIQFNLLFVGLIAVSLVTAALATLFRRKFQEWLPLVMAALIIGAGLDHWLNSPARTHELTSTGIETPNGPIIHVLMDGFIGPDGLPSDPESQILRSKITDFFRAYHFELYSRAYSHYSATLDSMTRLFNFRNDDDNLFMRATLLRQPLEFKENAWFKALDRSGRQLVVYQTEAVDFCSPELSQAVICNVFPTPNLNSLRGNLKSPLERAGVLLGNMASQSALIKKVFKDAGIAELGTWGISVYNPGLLSQMSRDIVAQPENAYFAHVLVPHAPMIFREDCSIDYSGEPWMRWPASSGEVSNTPGSRHVRRSRMRPHIECALRLLGGLFEELRANGLYEQSTIIVHGDHGTSLFLTKPSALRMNELTLGDLREAFSSLFAVKLPGGRFSLNEDIKSLNALMARSAVSILGSGIDTASIAVLEESEPFIYLGDVSPMTIGYVNIFESPEQESSGNDKKIDPSQ